MFVFVQHNHIIRLLAATAKLEGPSIADRGVALWRTPDAVARSHIAYITSGNTIEASEEVLAQPDCRTC